MKSKPFKQLLITTIYLSPSLALAAFCPTNFQQIQLGFTENQVIAACGEPSKKETKEQEIPSPQEWNYFLKQNAPIGGAIPKSNDGPALLKTSIFFDKEGHAISINVNGVGVGGTTICGSNIQLGSTRDEVKAACGKPEFVNKQQGFDEQNKEGAQMRKITKFIYDSTPPQTLVFEDDHLVRIER